MHRPLLSSRRCWRSRAGCVRPRAATRALAPSSSVAWMGGVALLLTLAPVAPSGVAAQVVPDEGRMATLRGLEGCWSGTGTLLGRPGAFEMAWRVESSEGFLHLAFRNSWTGEGRAPTPVLQARGTYLLSETPMVGVWLDDRPSQLRLEAVVTDTSLVTRWRGDTEEGRTEYVVRSDTTVRVVDHVVVDGMERDFAEATYRRVEAGESPICRGG